MASLLRFETHIKEARYVVDRLLGTSMTWFNTFATDMGPLKIKSDLNKLIDAGLIGDDQSLPSEVVQEISEDNQLADPTDLLVNDFILTENDDGKGLTVEDTSVVSYQSSGNIIQLETLNQVGLPKNLCESIF